MSAALDIEPPTIALGPHTLHHGPNSAMFATLDDCSVDACVTDPPYGLSAPPDIAEVLRCWLAGDVYEHGKKGFMSRTWDAFVPGPHVWRDLFRVLKPGAHAVVFAGSRTVDLMSIALRLAGFEVRDTCGWQYWSGFPKSLDLSKAIDGLHGADREVVGVVRKIDSFGEAAGNIVLGGGPDHGGVMDITAPATPDAIRWDGWATALKPCLEPFILVRKPISESSIARNVLRWGTGGLNIDACRYAYGDPAWPGPQEKDDTRRPSAGGDNGLCGSDTFKIRERRVEDTPINDIGRYPANVYACPKASTAERELGCEHLRQWSAGEMTGGRKEGSAGLDCPRAGAGRTAGRHKGTYSAMGQGPRAQNTPRNVTGRGNVHPTVKPLRLIRWLLRLVTPPGGVVVEPYAGSGTAFIAAQQANEHHGLDCTMIGAELGEEPGYIDIAPARYAGWERLGFPLDVPNEARGANDPRDQGTIWDAMT